MLGINLDIGAGIGIGSPAQNPGQVAGASGHGGEPNAAGASGPVKPPSGKPDQNGGPSKPPSDAAQGAASLGGGGTGDLASVLQSLVTTLNALVAAISKGNVGGASGGGPGQMPPGKVGGAGGPGCDMPMPPGIVQMPPGKVGGAGGPGCDMPMPPGGLMKTGGVPPGLAKGGGGAPGAAAAPATPAPAAGHAH